MKETWKIIKEYPSSCQVERVLWISSSSIRSCCRGERKSASGFIWRYDKI